MKNFTEEEQKFLNEIYHIEHEIRRRQSNFGIDMLLSNYGFPGSGKDTWFVQHKRTAQLWGAYLALANLTSPLAEDEMLKQLYREFQGAFEYFTNKYRGFQLELSPEDYIVPERKEKQWWEK